MKYHFIETPQTVEYDVMHAIECDKTQAYMILGYLNRVGRNHSIQAIRAASQRLRKKGMIVREYGLWKFESGAAS